MRSERGSILILESLDRLSRQQVFTALSLFSSILAAGVEIVTLAMVRIIQRTASMTSVSWYSADFIKPRP